MRISIEAGAVPRVIDGPFNLVGSTEDLRRVAVSILEQIEAGEKTARVQITAVQPALGNAQPVAWARL